MTANDVTAGADTGTEPRDGGLDDTSGEAARATPEQSDAGPEQSDSGPETAGAPHPGRWRRRLGAAAPWIVAVLALAAAIFSTLQWQDLEADAAARDRVVLAATDFATTLTNWDAGDGLEQTRQRLREAGTGEFLEEIDEFFAPLTDDLPADITSTGRVEDVFVQRIEGDTAEAFAVVVQTIDRGGQSQTSVRRTALSLTRVDGEWLVAEVRLLSDVAPPQGSEETP